MKRLFLLSALLAAGCTSIVSDFQDPDSPEVCGGAVCFAPSRTAVQHWGAATIELAAMRPESGACAVPTAGKSPVDGTALFVRLESPTPGARLPIVTRGGMDDHEGPRASVRAIRVHDGRPLADEEAVSGEVTILDLDSHRGSVRVRIRARWSSGVSGDAALEVAGPVACEPTS